MRIDKDLRKAVWLYLVLMVGMVVILIGASALEIWVKRDLMGVPYCISGEGR